MRHLLEDYGVSAGIGLVMILLIINLRMTHGKVIDIHLPSPCEKNMMEKVERDRENEKAERTLNDPSSTQQEREEACRTLIDNEGMS